MILDKQSEAFSHPDREVSPPALRSDIATVLATTTTMLLRQLGAKRDAMSSSKPPPTRLADHPTLRSEPHRVA